MARGTQGLQTAAAEVENRGGKALALPLDVADPDAVEAAADSVENQFGPFDIWVNCAMRRSSPRSIAFRPTNIVARPR